MAFHEPYYTTQSSPKLGQYFKQHLEPLFYVNAVDVVVNGHIHAYERSYPVYNNVVSARICILLKVSARTARFILARQGTFVLCACRDRCDGVMQRLSIRVRVRVDVRVCRHGFCSGPFMGSVAPERRWTSAPRCTSSLATAATRRAPATIRARRTR